MDSCNLLSTIVAVEDIGKSSGAVLTRMECGSRTCNTSLQSCFPAWGERVCTWSADACSCQCICLHIPAAIRQTRPTKLPGLVCTCSPGLNESWSVTYLPCTLCVSSAQGWKPVPSSCVRIQSMSSVCSLHAILRRPCCRKCVVAIQLLQAWHENKRDSLARQP